MHIVTINPSLLDHGRAVFDAGRNCGPIFGVPVVPGAIVGAVEAGIRREDQIARDVSRYTRCRQSTVKTVLAALSTNQNAEGLWHKDEEGQYRLVDQLVRPFAFLAS